MPVEAHREGKSGLRLQLRQPMVRDLTPHPGLLNPSPRFTPTLTLNLAST